VSRVNVRIRPAEHADVDSLVALTRSLDSSRTTFSGRSRNEPDAHHLARRFGEMLEEGEHTLLVACDDSQGEVVGLLVARQDEVGVIDVSRALHVSNLLVTPKHRRRGVGRALLAAAVHLADELGLDRMQATVSAGSREGNRYLARLGFAPVVMHRVASTGVLRRALGITDEPDRAVVLRRARVLKAQRTGVAPRAMGRGA
jgi:ribosomal protein S18 acetylase RimI-like enzyme